MKGILKNILLVLFGYTLAMAVAWFDAIAEENNRLHSLKGFLIDCPNLDWLSQDCMALLGEVRGFPDDSEFIDKKIVLNVASMRFLRPSHAYVQGGELTVIFPRKSMMAFAMKCKQDGSLWLYGDVIRGAPIRIYPKQ